LTIITVAFYMLNNTDRIKKSTFRNLVFALLFSFFYDLFWFFEAYSEYTSDKQKDNLEFSIKKFSATMSLLSMIFRVIVIAVFWKDSIDF